MRRTGWLMGAILVVAWLPHTSRAQDADNVTLTSGVKEIIKSMDLGWRPEPHDHEPFNQPQAMNGYSILNYFQTDAVALRRSAGSFNGGDLNWSVGPRIVLGRGLSDRDAIEVGYFAQYQMNGFVFAPGQNGPIANGREDYRSVMNSAEFNYRHWLTPAFSVLAGFRYLNWHEDLNAAVDVPGGSINQGSHTSNNLYGFQVGGDWKQMLTCKLGIEAGGKVGVFGARNAFDAALNVPEASSNVIGWHTSVVSEASVVGTYNLTHYLKARAGYQVMWVDGIALAPSNLVGATSVNSRGNVFLHGALLGLELWW